MPAVNLFVKAKRVEGLIVSPPLSEVIKKLTKDDGWYVEEKESNLLDMSRLRLPDLRTVIFEDVLSKSATEFRQRLKQDNLKVFMAGWLHHQVLTEKWELDRLEYTFDEIWAVTPELAKRNRGIFLPYPMAPDSHGTTPVRGNKLGVICKDRDLTGPLQVENLKRLVEKFKDRIVEEDRLSFLEGLPEIVGYTDFSHFQYGHCFEHNNIGAVLFLRPPLVIELATLNDLNIASLAVYDSDIAMNLDYPLPPRAADYISGETDYVIEHFPDSVVWLLTTLFKAVKGETARTMRLTSDDVEKFITNSIRVSVMKNVF